MKLHALKEKLRPYYLPLFQKPQTTYAQLGEDLIIDQLFRALKIKNPTYLDIGAHHPTYLSNTYYFYRQGYKGVCVEPNPVQFKKIARKRARDTNINAGIAFDKDQNGKKLPFYVMASPPLSTFSKQEAENVEAEGLSKIEQVRDIELIDVNQVIKKQLGNHVDFVSLDAEGLDFEILKTFDFSQCRPVSFCIESINYTETTADRKKNSDIIKYMADHNYIIYADTHINTIFIDKKYWHGQVIGYTGTVK